MPSPRAKPARVQVFYFEKKPRGPTRTDPCARTTEPTDLPTQEVEMAEGDARSAAALLKEATTRNASRNAAQRAAWRSELADPSRHPTEKIPAVGGPHSAPTELETPRLATPVPESSAKEALEYHRLKLQELASRPRGRANNSLAELALIGHMFYARGMLRQAQTVFEGIVAKEPEEAFAYTMLGAIFLAQEDETKALALFDAALGLEPGEMPALVGRAEIRIKRGQPQAALHDLERAIAADPSGRDPFSERARALAVLARTVARTQR